MCIVGIIAPKKGFVNPFFEKNHDIRAIIAAASERERVRFG